MNVQDLIPESHQAEELRVMRQLAQAQVIEPYRTQRLAKAGTVVEIWLTAIALVNEAGQMYAIATTERASG
jgi:two-component system CheB/CheR fusion protein